MRGHVVVFGTLVLCRVAAAQETTGDIRGRVRSEEAGAVSRAQVTAGGADLLGVRSAVSAADGVFRLLTLPPGMYTVRIKAIGYRPVMIEGVRVLLGQTTGLEDVRLERAATQLSEVRIVSPRTFLDPSRTTMGATIDAAEAAALPGDRDYTSIISTLPHANRSYRGDPVNGAGSTGLENMYFIDGVNVTAPIRADAGTALPYNFIRALDVKTGGYEAQYGRALGAIVNAITYSGTNEFEANVFAFLTNGALAVAPKAEPTLREVTSLSYDVGVRIGGPVVRDRLWYSAAYNPRLSSVDRQVTTLAAANDRRNAQVFAGKLSWQATPATNVEFSLFGDPAVHDAVQTATGWYPTAFAPLSTDPYLVRFESGGTVGSLRATTALGGRGLLEASVSQYRGRENHRGTSTASAGIPLYIDYVTQSVAGGWPDHGEFDIGRRAALLRGTVSVGRHTVTAGAEYEDVFQSGAYVQETITRTNSTTWIRFAFQGTGSFHNRAPTAYLQDAWRITDRVTLNAGVRWSVQTLTGANGLVAQRFPDQWQPRLGFVWQPGSGGRQRFFGSLGRFYQQVPLWLSGNAYATSAGGTSFYSTDPRQPGVVPDSANLSSYDFDPADPYIEAIDVEHFDEATFGYERLAGVSTKLTARVIRRELRSSNQLGYDHVKGVWLVGTPGKGNFAYLPAARREYTALEFGAQGSWRGFPWRSSYVWSRNWGNYAGFFDSDLGVPTPGNNRTFNAPHHATNSTGLLPNDRTHVFKLSATRAAGSKLRPGMSFTWASGTPISAFAPCPCDIPDFRALTVPRGSAGRTPPTWTLDVRLGYDMPTHNRVRSRVVLDVLNLGNPQGVVWTEELRWLENATGIPSMPNTDYGRALAYQRPMMARLGLEVSR